MANRSGYTELGGKELPPRYAGQLDGCGGMRVCVGVTLA